MWSNRRFRSVCQPPSFHTRKMPSRNPVSPSRVTRNAFRAAAAALGFSK
jgi:hypothetical protein